MGGGRNLATYPRCPKCHKKRDVGLALSAPGWHCFPCGLYFVVRGGMSVADGHDSYPADVKKVYHCPIHYREHLGVCPRCQQSSKEGASHAAPVHQDPEKAGPRGGRAA